MASLPDVEQRFEADVRPYIDALALAAQAAAEFADANREAAAAVEALIAVMERIPGVEFAAKMTGAGSAARDAARGEAEAAAGARDAAGAMSEEAGAAAKSAVANKAAAESANSAGRAAFNLANFERALNAQDRTLFATTNYLRAANDKLKDTFEALALAEAFTAQEGENLAQIQRDVATGDALAAQMARNLAEADAQLAAGAGYAAQQLADQARVAAVAAMADRALAFSAGQAAVATALQGGATQATAHAMGSAAQAAAGLALANNAATAAGNRANGAWRAQIGWLRVTGATIHWIIAGFAEFAAVAIPAIVALAAGALVGLQGAVEIVGRHMMALFTTMEATSAAFGKTTGDVLGLGHALQTAQDAANPGVYTILGSVINDAKTRFTDFASAGLAVIHVLDEFSARVTLDLKGTLGGQLHGLLANMVTDLQQFGQVFGNAGHALLNFASAMPGLAEMLLGLLDTITRVILAFSGFPATMFTVVMVFEEFFRWGGLALSMMVRLTQQMALMDSLGATGWITRFGAALRTLIMASGAATVALGTFISGLGRTGGAATRTGAAVQALGTRMTVAGAAMSNMGAVGLGAVVAAVLALGVAFDKVRNSAQRFIDQTNQALKTASDVQALKTITQAVGQASAKIQEQQAILRSYSSASQDAGRAVGGFVSSLQSLPGPMAGVAQGELNVLTSTNGLTHTFLSSIPVFGNLVDGFDKLVGGPAKAASQIDQLEAAQKRWLGTAGTMFSNSKLLAGALGTDLPGAFALANDAGVNLQVSMKKNSAAFAIALQQIRNLEQGIGAMSAPAGVIGADMEALGIQSQLAGSKVQQLNQAWDAWMASVTGGLSAMSQVQVALAGIDKGALSANASLSGALRGVKLGTKDATYSLQGFGTTAMKSWQQFLGAIQPAQQAMDSLRLGMAEGAVTSRQFGSTVRGLVGEFLPFVKGNQDAVRVLSQFAHQAGGPVTGNLKQLAQWAGVAGKAARDQFARGMEAATASMSAMSKVAQNLSAVIGQQLDSAMAAAISKNSGLNDAITKYAADLKDASTPASVLRGDVLAISQAEQRATQMTAEASRGLDQAARSAAHAGAAARSAANDVSALVAAIDALHSKTININVITTHQGIFVGGGGPRAISGHASGTSFAQPGLAMVGERGPELIQARGGERIFSNPETAAILGGGQHPGLAAEAGGAAAAGPQAVELHSHIYIDGQQVFESMQQHGLVYNTRNSGARTGKYIPGP